MQRFAGPITLYRENFLFFFDHSNIPNGSPFGYHPMRGPFFPQGIN